MAFGDPMQEILFDNIKMADGKATQHVRAASKTVFDGLQAEESCGPGEIHTLGYNYRSTQEILDFIVYIRDKIEGKRYGFTQVYSVEHRHGLKPLCIYTSDGRTETLLDEALTQIDQLSSREKENVILIFSNKSMLKEAHRLLTKLKTIPFSLMDGLKGTYELSYIQDILLYLRLIEDPSRDIHVERLLRHNIVPYLDNEQIELLKESALRIEITLFDLISVPEYLRDAKIQPLVQEKIHKHLQIIKQLQLSDPFERIEEKLRALDNDSPWYVLKDQPDRLYDIDNLLTDFRQHTIKDIM
jgi:superfamily I DNA/RNA helicase